MTRLPIFVAILVVVLLASFKPLVLPRLWSIVLWPEDPAQGQLPL